MGSFFGGNTWAMIRPASHFGGGPAGMPVGFSFDND
jgi:hypothetical protein